MKHGEENQRTVGVLGRDGRRVVGSNRRHDGRFDSDGGRRDHVPVAKDRERKRKPRKIGKPH